MQKLSLYSCYLKHVHGAQVGEWKLSITFPPEDDTNAQFTETMNLGIHNGLQMSKYENFCSNGSRRREKVSISEQNIGFALIKNIPRIK